MTGQFEIFRDGALFWFRLLGEEREVLAVSGAFAEKAQAAKAIMAVRENAAAGHIVDKSSTATSAEPAPKTCSPLARRAARQPARPGGRPELRGSTIVSGLAVVLDLRQAAVGTIPLGKLRSACQSGELPSVTGSASTPCRLEILEPAAG
jgi:uncharacterized protein YegP (UPF0339 family)